MRGFVIHGCCLLQEQRAGALTTDSKRCSLVSQDPLHWNGRSRKCPLWPPLQLCIAKSSASDPGVLYTLLVYIEMWGALWLTCKQAKRLDRPFVVLNMQLFCFCHREIPYLAQVNSLFCWKWMPNLCPVAFLFFPSYFSVHCLLWLKLP